MKSVKKIRKIFVGLLAALVLTVMGAGIGAVPVRAASGNIYTCVIHPCYAHPVTGVIEDSGGEASYATGQGMVDGAVYTTGILELTDSGEYYLTIRMSLMDYTSNHSFWVQNVGDSNWSSPAIGVTGNGTDDNGATADICMQVPSENCVVRGSMYVEPMGRDVIFYLYPSDYTAGNNTNMNATIVTEASGSGGTSTYSGSGSTSTESGTSGSGSTNTQSESTGNGNASLSGSSLQSDSELLSSDSSDTEPVDNSTEAPALSSSIDEAAQPTPSTDAELSDAQGLSLSTAADTVEEAEDMAGSSGGSVFVMGTAVTVSGLILMGTAAVIVYFFRKNWRRWGGGYDDDEA
ncbi:MULTISPECIES: heme-binding Shp domain-containing protein [unclassified Blautia]|uniref:heme-binding Shp domain-containing protein n=1 Tax=unclassified Blautia TaxID=2648079 RepID=UPI000B399E2B|nr:MULTISPECIES: heme-binding Shp domain-containing protein [unclassified Blautia]OUN27770.1 hypothetical protein B5G33_13115 [Blautia sp. An81]OUN94419.1 hypothetical protein B5G00_02640 [Blautia sp. An46]